MRLKKNTTYETFGELEIINGSTSHFGKKIAKIGLFLVSNTVQESIKETEILPALSSGHSPIVYSLVSAEPSSKRKELWKFNNSLLLNEEIVTKLRTCIHLKINEMIHENINDDQIRWEFLKYETGKFFRKCFKTLAIRGVANP